MIVRDVQRRTRDGRELWVRWRIELDGERQVRRELYRMPSGELLDAAWLDAGNRTRSWS